MVRRRRAMIEIREIQGGVGPTVVFITITQS